jgi:tetratricopeptide (TPR) repeat protein
MPPCDGAAKEFYYHMLRRLWLSTLIAAAGSALLVGCRSLPLSQPSPAKENAADLKREMADERALAKAAEAHAHYARGVLHEMNEEQEAATAEYSQAALLDPANEGLILEVSQRLMQTKQPEKALEIVNRATAEPNASGRLYARQGLIYAQLGKTEQAIAANRQAILRTPDALDPYQNLCLIYLRAKQPQEALKILDDAAARPKVAAEYLVAVADLYMTVGLGVPAQKEVANARALAVLKRADQLNPTNPALRLRMADSFNMLGESTRAARLYLEALKRLPDAPMVRERVRANLADIYLRGSENKLAAEQLEALIRDDPTNPKAYYLLGRFALEANKPAEAVEHFKKMLVLSPDFEPVYYLLAMAQIDLNKPAEAVATLEKARKKFPSSFALEFWTATALSRKKDYAEAMKHYTAAEVTAKATDAKQLDERFYFQLGATCERMGDFTEAAKYFERSIQIAPNFAESLNYLGYMWAEHGTNLVRAKELIEKAVKAEPKSAAYLDSLAWVLFKLDQPKEALPYALKSVELCETPDATVYDHLGDIYAALKQIEKAREAWRKALELEPNPAIQKKLDAPGSN